jgi:hypothetical protein
VPSELRQRHNDVASFIYAVLGVVYAVVLGLVFIAVWEDYREASNIVESEANALAAIYWLAHRLPVPDNFQLQKLARAYARKVVDEEWLLIEQGKTSVLDWRLLDDIRVTLQGLKPRTRAAQEIYAEGLEQVQGLAEARRTRLIAAKETISIVL